MWHFGSTTDDTNPTSVFSKSSVFPFPHHKPWPVFSNLHTLESQVFTEGGQKANMEKRMCVAQRHFSSTDSGQQTIQLQTRERSIKQKINAKRCFFYGAGGSVGSAQDISCKEPKLKCRSCVVDIKLDYVTVIWFRRTDFYKIRLSCCKSQVWASETVWWRLAYRLN